MGVIKKKIPMRLQGLSGSRMHVGAFAMILAEEDGHYRLPIIIGTPEAQSIAIALEGIKPPRPLTHDLMVKIISRSNMEPKEIIIYHFNEGVYHSFIVFDREGVEIQIDARTSDAIALAIRMGLKIYAMPEVIEAAGILVEDEDVELDKDLNFNQFPDLENKEVVLRWLKAQDAEALKEQLKKSVMEERYEWAQRIQKELNDREDSEDKK